MSLQFTQERSVPGFRAACQNLAAHTRNFIILKTLIESGIDCVDANQDAFGHREATSQMKNIQANIQVERQNAEVLHAQLETAFSVLKGHTHPSVALASTPCPMVGVAAEIVGATKTLEVLAESKAEAVERGLVVKNLLKDIRVHTRNLENTINTLNGLSGSLESKRFSGVPGTDQWQKAVDTSVGFIKKKHAGDSVYKVPTTMIA